jgi:cysteine desulfurase
MTSKFAKKSCPNPIYLDNNGTTIICPPAKKIYIDWLGCYNASSDSKIAKPAKALIEKASDYILAHCNVSSATHTVIFTSGATESNCFILRSCVKAYKKKMLERGSILKPHIISSKMEHHSIIECLNDLEETGDVEVTFVTPTIYGNILAEDVEKEIKTGQTCLISIMFANNEVPVINNIEEIGAVAHKNRIPLHSDCVQIFGKYKIDMVKNNIDAISATAHKFYGPKGTGILIISNKLIEGYGLTAEISGTQQHNLRGGTENVAGIASLSSALKWDFANRKTKNTKLFKLREYTLEKLKKIYHFGEFADYVNGTSSDNSNRPPLELVSLGPPEDKPGFILPNTILLSIVKNKGKPLCNIDLKKALDDKNCIVSIGSACLTKSDKSSHTLSAIGAPPVIKRGVIRISFGDYNVKSDVDKFIKILVECINKQCIDIKKEIADYDNQGASSDDHGGK